MKKIIPGFLVKKLMALVFLMTLTGKAGLFAIPLRIAPPQLGGEHPERTVIQDRIDSTFRAEAERYSREVQGIDSDPQEMIRAFATSSVFSSTGASLRAYQGYDNFALTVGAMGGIQLPVSVFSMFNAEIANLAEKIVDDMNRDNDLRIGINPQIINAQFGVNTSKFLLKGLYLGLKGGYTNLNLNLEDFRTTFQTLSAGALINYQVIPQTRYIGGVVVWRGLNIGTGFIYQRTSLTMGVPLFAEDGDAAFPITGNIVGLILDPRLEMRFSVNTYTVPLEAVTSIRLLGFLNASFGGGMDFGFGSATLGGGVDADITVEGLPLGLRVDKKGSFSVIMGGTNTPFLFNPKAMASLGFSIGPAIIMDIPITYYFLNNGYNIGITLGLAF